MYIEIPDDLGVTKEQAHLDFAVGLYISRSASLARAATPARLSRTEFQSAHLLVDQPPRRHRV